MNQVPIKPENTEEEIVLLRAEAIKHFRSIKLANVKKDLLIQLSGTTAPYDDISIKIGSNIDWQNRLASEIFMPLLEQGLDRYKEVIQKIAETGELPWQHP